MSTISVDTYCVIRSNAGLGYKSYPSSGIQRVNKIFHIIGVLTEFTLSILSHNCYMYNLYWNINLTTDSDGCSYSSQHRCCRRKFFII